MIVCFELFHEIAPLCAMIENPRLDMYSLSQGEAILWKSLKQTVTTSSTMYAEFVACEATGHVNWLKKFIPSLKVVDDIYRPLKLYCDYNLAVQYAHNIS